MPVRNATSLGMDDQSALRSRVTLLTEAEAAELLRLHPVSLARLRRRGDIAYVSTGRRPRYLLSQISEFIERRVVAMTPVSPKLDPPSPVDNPVPQGNKRKQKSSKGRHKASTEPHTVKPVDRLAADTFALLNKRK